MVNRNLKKNQKNNTSWNLEEYLYFGNSLKTENNALCPNMLRKITVESLCFWETNISIYMK